MWNNHPVIHTRLGLLYLLAVSVVCKPTHPEVCMTVDHHGALDQFIWTLQKVVARDDAGVVDQYVHLSHLLAHLLGCGIDALPLSHVTHIGVDLRLERRDLLDPSNMA